MVLIYNAFKIISLSELIFMFALAVRSADLICIHGDGLASGLNELRCKIDVVCVCVCKEAVLS